MQKPRNFHVFWGARAVLSRLGERSERASAASEASGAIRMNSRGLLRKSISKDAFRVREGCFRKAIQIVSPRGFILNALPVLLLTPGL